MFAEKDQSQHEVLINMIMIRPQWRDLTSGGSWTYMPSLSTHYYTRLIALSSTEAYMVTIIIIVVVNQLLKNRRIALFSTKVYVDSYIVMIGCNP